MVSLDDYKGAIPAWCPGCGNFSILKAFKEAMTELEIEPHRLAVVSGIGQAGKFPHYIRCNTFNGLHGRSVPVATGLKLANHTLHVVAVGGDGDMYGEGGNHLIHAMRRNIGISVFVHNNQIYGLTKGQASPTSMEGTMTSNQPFGVLSEPLNPLAMAVALDCSFVGRGYVADQEHLKALIKTAIQHKGFSLVDILQPCVSFNKVNTYEWYGKRVYRIAGNHDPENRVDAFQKALEWGESIPIGIIYRNNRTAFEERVPIIREKALAEQPVSPDDMKRLVTQLLNSYY
jgi:2-oxoglutarate/2-oxoacid ferredoxin oxidoreductase subunit beta